MDPTQISQPDYVLFGLRILEPVTTITDILVAAVCLYSFWQLNRGPLSGKTILFMKWYFFSMGLATFLGGIIGHGFLYAFNEHWIVAKATHIPAPIAAPFMAAQKIFYRHRCILQKPVFFLT